MDRYVLHELSQLENDAIAAYDAFAFNRGKPDPTNAMTDTDMPVLQSTTNLISTTLSSFYFDAVKDTLYCQVSDSPDRLAVVATLCEVSLLSVFDKLSKNCADGCRYPELFERSLRLLFHI